MKNTMKKMLAVVLVLVMCVSVAMPVFAAEATAKCPGDATKQHTKDNCDAEAVVGGKHEPTCQKQGYTVYQCKGCDKYFADDIVAPLGGAEGQCDWEVVTPATCATPGKQVCKRCGAVDEISTDTVPHQYEWDTDATCGFPGAKKIGICKVCKIKTTVDLSEHEFPTLPEIDVYPECGGKEGKAHYTCKKCEYKKYVVIYSLDDHMDLVDLTDKIKPATCEAGGLQIKTNPLTGKPYDKAEKCTVCGYDTTEAVNAQHKWGAEYTLAPTCTSYGFVFRGCELCGKTNTEQVIDKAGHYYVSDKPNAKCGEDVTLTCDWSQYKCTNSKCVVNGVHTLHPTTGCGDVQQLKGKECQYEARSSDPTCVTPGYKWEECKVCGDIKGGVKTQSEPATGVHNWNPVPVYNPTTDPTCQHPGIYTYLCMNEGCTAFRTEDRPQLEHVYDKGVTYQPMCGVNGYIVYTCTQPGCNVAEAGKPGVPHTKIEMPDSLKFNPANPAHHGVLADGLAAGTIVPTLNSKNPVTGLPYPNTEATCGAGAVTTYKCEICTARNPFFDHDNNPNTTSVQPWVTFAVVGEAQEHLNKTITTPADLPTHCGDTGVTEGWSCSACNKTVESVAVKATTTAHSLVVTSTNTLPTCSKPVNYKCDCEFDIVDDKGNVYVKGVKCNYTKSDVCTGNVDTLADFRDNDCVDWGYQHFECPKCQEGYIDNFEYATGHNMVEDKTQFVPAECVKDGQKVFNCDNKHTNYDGKVVECTVKDNTVEVLPAIGHLDKDGNVINCTDANGKPITENVLCFRKEADGGCCTCAADATCEGHSVAWKPLHDWVDTTVEATCVHYKYILHVCSVCQYDYTETIFVKADHNLTGAYKVDNKGNILKDKDGNPIPDFSNTRWKDVAGKEATYTKAGEKSFQCLTAGCTHKVTAPYYKDDIRFTISYDSGIKSGADIVNSGTLLVTINASAYDIDLYSIDLDLYYNSNVLTYKGFEVSDFTKKLVGASGVEVGTADSNNVGIYIANSGKTPTNVELDKIENQALITLKFEVKAGVNSATSGKTTTQVYVKDSESVLDADKETKVKSSVATATTITIKALGNVTEGTIESTVTSTRVDDYDARALVEIMMSENGYSATADINKDGKVDSKDYAALAKYIAAGSTYPQLCATK